MKRLIFLFIAFYIGNICNAQNNGPREITDLELKQIKADVEKQIPDLKKKLIKQELNTNEIEYYIDTFRINHIAQKRMYIDYSTAGMNIAVDELTDSYDKVLNKCYNKLLNILKSEDKKILVAAQKAWIVYRDAENKLIWTMTKTEYSGGGTIQSNIATGSYSSIVTQRSNEIFHYYNSVLKENN